MFESGWLSTILSVAGIVFLAELGDKTMISTAILALRTKRFVLTLMLSLMGFVLANSFVITIAWLLHLAVSSELVNLIGGSLFIVVGTWMLIERTESKTLGGGAALGFLTIALAELGDKTQIAMFTIALTTSTPIYVLIGGALGYVAANVIGVLIARMLSLRFPWRKIKVFASAIMMSVGLWLIIKTLCSFPYVLLELRYPLNP